MKHIDKLNLQLFGGEGAAGASGAGGDGAGTTGDHGASAPATADAAQRLRELGVPEDKIRKRASNATSRTPAQTAQIPAAGTTEEAAVAPAATQKPATEETKSTALSEMNWEEITRALADSHYSGDFTYEADQFLKGFEDDFKPTACRFMADYGRHLIAKIKTYQEN